MNDHTIDMVRREQMDAYRMLLAWIGRASDEDHEALWARAMAITCQQIAAGEADDDAREAVRSPVAEASAVIRPAAVEPVAEPVVEPVADDREPLRERVLAARAAGRAAGLAAGRAAGLAAGSAAGFVVEPEAEPVVEPVTAPATVLADDREPLRARVLAALGSSYEPASVGEIAGFAHESHDRAAVSRVLKELRAEGKATMVGKAKGAKWHRAED